MGDILAAVQQIFPEVERIRFFDDELLNAHCMMARVRSDKYQERCIFKVPISAGLEDNPDAIAIILRQALRQAEDEHE